MHLFQITKLFPVISVILKQVCSECHINFARATAAAKFQHELQRNLPLAEKNIPEAENKIDIKSSICSKICILCIVCNSSMQLKYSDSGCSVKEFYNGVYDTVRRRFLRALGREVDKN